MANTVAELTQMRPADLKITQRMIPWTNSNRPGSKLNPNIQWWFTQHTTGNRASSASANFHAIFVGNGGGADNVSFHLTVDDKEAIQLLPFDEAGYHAADGMDDYYRDVGGWGSIAMELCVNTFNDPARWLKAKQNAVAAWASILIGDSRWDYGTGGPQRFSVDRLAPHHKWSDELKWCPTELLDEGNIDQWTGDGPMKDAIRVLSGAGEGTVSGSIYPVGMDLGIARMLFGFVALGDKTYKFAENGVISNLWLAHGKASGQWPTLVSVKTFDTRTYFIFDGGYVLWSAGNGKYGELK